MEKRTNRQIDQRIELFLDTKLAKFPELRQLPEDKTRWSANDVWKGLGKIFNHQG